MSSFLEPKSSAASEVTTPPLKCPKRIAFLSITFAASLTLITTSTNIMFPNLAVSSPLLGKSSAIILYPLAFKSGITFSKRHTPWTALFTKMDVLLDDCEELLCAINRICTIDRKICFITTNYTSKIELHLLLRSGKKRTFIMEKILF